MHLTIPTPKATDTTTGTVKTDVLQADPVVYTKATVDTLLSTLSGLTTGQVVAIHSGWALP